MRSSRNSRVEISDGIVFTSFEADRYVLLEIGQGNYYELEGAAGFLWSQWRQDGSVLHAIERLVERYRIDPAVAEADVLDLLSELESHALVKVADAA